MTTTRRLAAILAADVAGYSRLMAADEIGTLTALKAVRREVVDPSIAEHKGRIVKTTGDGMLVEFGSAVDAVTCAMAVQDAMAGRGGEITFRIGINVGDIIIDSDDIFGDGVNVAARVENECAPGGVYLSAQAFDQVRNKTAFAFDDLGERSLKNIDRPIRVYAVRDKDAAAAMVALPEPGKPPPLPDKPSIAVLPFQNMSGDPEQEYFADGMVEDIVTALSRFSTLSVIARNSSFAYKGKPVDIKQIGRELGARYVLEGSVRKAGDRVRITGQLIEAASNTHLWADKFEGALADVFELQDKITASIVGVVEPTIQHKEFDLVLRRPTDSLDAYDCVLKGWAHYNAWTREANLHGDAELTRALALDPDYAGAMVLKAQLRVQRVMQGWSADEAKDIAEGVALADKSLETGRNDAGALANIAFLRAFFLGDVVSAVTLVDRALELNPNLYVALEISAWIHLLAGHAELAIKHCRRARELNPFGTLKSPEALGQFLLGNEAEALALANQLVLDFPRSTTALRFAAIIKVSLGQREDAQKIVGRLLELKPNSSTAPGPWIAHQQNSQYKQRFMEALQMMGELGLRQG